MDPRLSELKSWSVQQMDQLGENLSSEWRCDVVAGDASFRRYFRIVDGGNSWIIVDAPPEKEDSAPFVAVARQWQSYGVSVPEVLAEDLELGFMLLEDFGDEQLLPRLNPGSADTLYSQACDELMKIQRCEQQTGRTFPPYDIALLQREVELFRDWFLGELLVLTLDAEQQALLDNLFAGLIGSALQQPQVCVHRDFHSRNLMLCDDGRVGVIDFQDAVWGPVTYDLVSLLRDCYIAWPEADIDRWLQHYWQSLEAERPELINGTNIEQFRVWFDLMGMQRHLKAVGIFARLKIRDGKEGYLQDIPRTLSYLINVGARYPQFASVVTWLRSDVVPTMRASGIFNDDAMQRWLT
ncbi:phosphotransferase [Pontibacterium granulatum]|uniref:aminoglycoside phosphotransferase family protein n=1 Tax=Pontibacterium granulatum TaxID=2036029 RepID=UPI00249C88D2|nr:phosphotransferase [Pontibacterium granulatum]MDI3322824.1 phosphotransferase [Pontibacterium granulatum]